MGAVKKHVTLLILLLIIVTSVFAVTFYLNYDKKRKDAEQALLLYAKCYACRLEDYRIKGSHYEIKMKKTLNTDAVVDFFQREGYSITFEEIESDYDKGMSVLKKYCEDHDIKDLIYVSADVINRLGMEGYDWKLDE